MCKRIIVILVILCFFCFSYSVHAEWFSQTFGGTVDIPDWTPSAPIFGNIVDIGPDYIRLFWSASTHADYTWIEWDSVEDTSWNKGDHNFTCNVSALAYKHSSLSEKTTYYYKAWSWNASQNVWSTGSVPEDFTTKQRTWHEQTFGGEAEVLADPIIIDVAPTIWTAGNINVNTDIQNNFTLWQNGSANIDITIGLNATNFSLVNYATWDGAGHNQITANFTDNNWVSETNMNDVSYPFTNTLKTDYAPGNFNFGVHIWLPKSLDAESVDEEFEVVVSVSEHT